MPIHVEITDADGNVLATHDHDGDDWRDACVAAQEVLRDKMTKGLVLGKPGNPPQPLSVRWKLVDA
jgi:hypothetical protein